MHASTPRAHAHAGSVAVTPTTLLEARMKRVLEIGRRLLREEDGIAITEYGMLIAIVAVGLLLVVKTFRTNLTDWFKTTTDKFFTEAK
jgi:Flp pilus assembly pilin Flp